MNMSTSAPEFTITRTLNVRRELVDVQLYVSISLTIVSTAFVSLRDDIASL